MKFNDIKIGTLLRLGLGSILLLVVFIGALAWRQTDVLWEQTKEMYDHPLTVSRALGQLEVIERDMAIQVRDVVLAKSPQDVTDALQQIETGRVESESLFVILHDRYLGPRADIQSLQREFAKWSVLRDETIRLLRSGESELATSRIRQGGVQDHQAKLVRDHLRLMDNFARNKSDELYATATRENSSLNRQLVVFLTLILGLSTFIVGILLRAIKPPLAELTAVSEKITQGKLNVRCQFSSRNEFGKLSEAFNAMADELQGQAAVTQSAAHLTGVMLREEHVTSFCRELLNALVERTNAQLGAIYLLNEAGTEFERIDSVGLHESALKTFPAASRAGELGTALTTRRIVRVSEPSPDTQFSFSAVSGTILPRDLLTVPVIADGVVVALISLASVRTFAPPTLTLIDNIWSVLSARINGILLFRKLGAQAEQLKAQNRELDEQKRELTEQNVELDMQKRQLDESNRLKSTFLSNMSHELRTPLNSVIALSGVLNRRLTGQLPTEELSYLEIIERNGKNLLALINDLLDLSRIEAGHADLALSQFTIGDVVDDVVAMLQPLALEKPISLENQLPADLPVIVSDAMKCRHILQNLIGNAVKFTERGGVRITADVSANHLRVKVVDTGIGIAPENLPHVFDEFRQGDGSTSRRYGGTGLGLTIAREYARMLGGDIAVRSEPAEGSTFTLRLPLTLDELPAAKVRPGAPDPARVDDAPSSAAPAGAVGENEEERRPCILVVEDNEPAIIQLTDILQVSGYRVEVARDGRQALENVGAVVPDAMILDLMMPEVDGFAVLKEIRRRPPTSQLPVIVLTAKHITPDELSFLTGNHIHQVIQKGDINKAGLLSAVSRMVGHPKPPACSADRSISTAPTQFDTGVDNATASLRSTGQDLPRADGRPRLLVVEDNADSRRVVFALLGEQFDIVEADDGRAGIKAALNHPPDLILMDIAMPHLDGINALREIRRHPALQHIPVIAVTASAMKGDQESILANGFDAYVTKPISREILLTTLKEALNRMGH